MNDPVKPVSSFPSNPANGSTLRARVAGRVPMGGPEAKLSVPALPGYIQHWFLDSPGRISRALQGGWEFVDRGEVELSCNSLADDAAADGNSDLGTRVSVYGSIGDKGEVQRLYLMKLREEFAAEDTVLANERNMKPMEAVRNGTIGSDTDSGRRYGTVGGLPFKTSGGNRQ